MECLIGLRGKDFVLIASDKIAGRSIMAYKQDHDKMFQFGSHLITAVSGEAGDATQFAEYIAKNIQLYKMRNGYELSPHAAASFTRKNMADYLRSSTPYMVNLLMAGYDDDEGPQLFFLDYLASMVKVPFAAHGYGSYFSLGIMDRYHKEDMTKDEGVELLQKCINEIQTRFIVNLSSFKVRMVNKDGVHDLPDLIAKKLHD